tara:strand:- start:537 stop:884 length:348 start_codon:yes stop_codon:yes gene_type:complete
MNKLSREQKISNLKKVFTDRGYIHDFVKNKQGDILEGDKEQIRDFVMVSYWHSDSYKSKRKLRILSGTTTTKRTSDNRFIDRTEPYEWFVTLEDAENLICFLEAFIETEKEQESA